jgi:hypothetical protein
VSFPSAEFDVLEAENIKLVIYITNVIMYMSCMVSVFVHCAEGAEGTFAFLPPKLGHSGTQFFWHFYGKL